MNYLIDTTGKYYYYYQYSDIHFHRIYIWVVNQKFPKENYHTQSDIYFNRSKHFASNITINNNTTYNNGDNC